MNPILILCLFVLSKSESLTLRRASVPSVTIPVARQTLPTNVNIPGVSTDVNLGVGTVFPGTQTTVGTAGLDVVLRGAELIADRIASALGGIAVLVDVIRNTSVNGDVVWANIGSSSQALATRLLTIGMNTANTLLQDLNGQLSVNANPSTVLQNFLPNMGQLGSIGSISRSPGISNQVFFPNGIFPTGQPNNVSGAPGVSNQVFYPNGIFTTGQPNNASGSVPGVAEVLNTITSNFNGVLPSVTTISTSRPGLNIPSTTTENVADVTEAAQNQNVNSEVETFLGNLANNGNLDVNP